MEQQRFWRIDLRKSYETQIKGTIFQQSIKETNVLLVIWLSNEKENVYRGTLGRDVYLKNTENWCIYSEFQYAVIFCVLYTLLAHNMRAVTTVVLCLLLVNSQHLLTLWSNSLTLKTVEVLTGL